jgi:hypothetical protein
MADDRPISVDEETDKGGAHAGVIVVALCRSEHSAIGEMNAGAQPISQKGQFGVDTVRPRQIGVILGATDEATQRFERQLRRHLTGIMTTHAIGDGEQADLRCNQPCIFVDRSYWSDLGLGVRSQH